MSDEKKQKEISKSTPAEPHRLVQDRLNKVEQLREAGINPYPYSFDQMHHADEILEKHKVLKPESKTEDTVAIAGRIVLLRNMGKIAFGHIMDATGKIQFMLNKEELGDTWQVFKKLDMGDFIGIKGNIITTRTGEITVFAKTLELLTKSIRPLPEKHHGLQDVETRYRKRYLDLISNPDVQALFRKRAKIIATMRNFLDEKQFLEVETPTLQPVYGGANARPFITHHNALDIDLFLRISDELYLKRLLVGGFERVYELCKDFRNEGVDKSHNPEFTMLEWYQAYGDYHTGMEMVEQMIEKACLAINGTTKVEFQGKKLDFKAPWKRAKMTNLIKEHAKIDVEKEDESALRKFCEKNNIECAAHDSWGILVQHIFEEFCEEHLILPTFVIDHPIETTPLCKQLRSGDQRLVERFEAFCAGMEITNAYSELNDPVLQKKLFQDQQELKMAGDDEAHPMDEEYVEALEYGLPPTSGVGIGVDRIVMLLTGAKSIRDVILFPTMKPE